MFFEEGEIQLKRKFALIVFIIAALGITTLFTPEIEAKSERQKWLDELERIKREESQTNKAMNDAEKKITSIKMDIKKATAEINSLDQQIEETEGLIVEKEEEISITEGLAEEASQLLDEAIARVAERDELLKVRVRALYETGEVSYIEALLDSESIGDFLSRMDMMEKVVNSDKQILADNIADKEEIESRKLQLDAFLEQLRGDYAVLFAMKEDLQRKYKEKTVFIASLEVEEEEWIKEEERLDAELAQLAKEKAKVNLEIKKTEYSGGAFTWPVPDSYKITSNYGYRTHPVTGKKQSFHSGTDIGAPQGTTIVAGAAGEVILAKKDYGTYGNTIMIDHGGIVTLYAHIRHGGILVKEGDQVKRGQKIAEVGSTGRSTGPHLHFSVLKNGEYLDPMKYLKSK